MSDLDRAIRERLDLHGGLDVAGPAVEALREVLDVCEDYRGEHIINAGAAVDEIMQAIARALHIEEAP